MKNILLLFIFTYAVAVGQDSTEKITQEIVKEGKELYKLEMGAWYGTDAFLEEYKNTENIGGYFSYIENGLTNCVFYSRSSEPKVIGTVVFDSTYNTNTARVELMERAFKKNEKDLYLMRMKATKVVQTDTLFKTYENTNLNFIPIIYKNQKKVYIITGPQQSGVVIFGNDYLISFNEENNITNKKQLHQNIIPLYYESEKESDKSLEAIHSHSSETGDFITPTDICTLMLYSKFTEWNRHTVVSPNYYNFWDCKKNSLVVLKKDVFEKITKDQSKRKKKRDKKKKKNKKQ